MSKTHYVIVPFAGFFTVAVDSERELSTKKAYRLAVEQLNDSDVKMTNIENFEHVEWDFYSKIVEGNVCHLYVTQAEITDIVEGD